MLDKPPRAIVTLIHGTWARRQWANVKPRDRWPAMQQELSTLAESVKIHTFLWSGHNRVGARAKAAEDFAIHLKELEVPAGVPHYVVAHSHGGTVVALALTNKEIERRAKVNATELRAKVSALVCLSTPFFQVRTRSLADMHPRMLGAGMLANGLLLAWLSYRGAMWTWPSLIGRALAAIFGIIFVAGALSPIADRVKERMEIQSLERVPVLVVRAPSDDTTLPLTLLQCLGWGGQWAYWFSHQLARLTSKGTDVVMAPDTDTPDTSTKDQTPKGGQREGRPLWIQLAPFVYAVGCYLLTAHWYGDGITWRLLLPWNELSPRLMGHFMSVAVPPLIVAVAVTAGSALIVYALASILAALTSFLIGPELTVAGLYLDVDVEAAPPGKCDFRQLSVEERAQSKIQHGTHSNPAAIRYVVEWLRARGGSPTTAVPRVVA
jgi:hypothetical protein